jgi:hypothetical protein
VVLGRTLTGLPDHMLAALVDGLEHERGRLVDGRLFLSSAGGGCAVGVLLRELDPAAFEAGRLRFWLRHGWRRTVASYPGVAKRQPRLAHLERIFDECVSATRRAEPPLSARAAADRVGRWIESRARAELRRRGRASETARRDCERPLQRKALASARNQVVR